MRGYYEGRYRDKHSLEATVELRQHVWKRNGIVVWVGAGTIFPKFSALRSKQILPNAGVGYRLGTPEAKKAGLSGIDEKTTPTIGLLMKKLLK